MVDLVLTLGHNSSAIAVDDGVILDGYEEERFTGLKADSDYPRNCIDRLCDTYAFDTAYVSHWNVDGVLADDKHFDRSHIMSVVDKVISVNTKFTHHDAHAMSAVVFAGEAYTQDCLMIVADGFGTMGEVMSMYNVHNGKPKLFSRFFGYEKSLGLYYQYATSYMGMKEHNHEYKMLAYETLISSIDVDTDALNKVTLKKATKIINSYTARELHRETDPLRMVSALGVVKQQVHAFCDDVVACIESDNPTEHEIRVVVSFAIQHIVERVMAHMCKGSHSKLLLVGGLFYNVKLNWLLSMDHEVCVMPIAGDQGAGLGVYAHYNHLQWPDHIFWGSRDLTNFQPDDDVLVYKSMDDAMSSIIMELKYTGFVNLVRGAMEFGPRSLCNTCTLGLPTEEVVDTINQMNGRTSEMPMAPVVTQSQYDQYFKNNESVYKSSEYMIIARQYKDGMSKNVKGVAHEYPKMNLHTGRPQVTKDPHLVTLLDTFGPLINSSYNYHGRPIVFERESILSSLVLQRQALPDVNFQTFIITGE